MSRYNPKHDSKPIYEAATQWKDRCLLDDGSILQQGLMLWTPALIDELDQRYVRNLDEGEGDFLEKLQGQLKSGSSNCRKLMSECLWILMLFQSNISAAKKRENVREIWSWSGVDLPGGDPSLSDAALEGLGSGGAAYNTQRWRELAFLISAVRDFKKLDYAERQRILSDGWSFTDWLSKHPEAGKRQLRHILPHLLFPDSFERISSGQDKRAILSAYLHETDKNLRTWDLVKIDRAVLEVRRRLEKDSGGEIDFYEKEYSALWKTGVKTWLLAWNPNNSKWATLQTERAATLRGEKVSRGWRCVSSKPREGDRAYLVRSGVEPRGIVAFGTVVRAPYDAPHYNDEKAAAGETARFIDVEFSEIRDAATDEIVRISQLEGKEPAQTWTPQGSGIEIEQKAAVTLERLWKSLPRPTGARGQQAQAIVSPTNLIFYGPPGTGKTHRLMSEFVPRYSDRDGKRYDFVTFHQNYSYEDFIEGIRPVTANGQVTYKVLPGVLKRLCERARKDPDRRYALFVDEINRGNVPKIFGELITLVETEKRIRTDGAGKRQADCSGLEVTLPYSGESFGIPVNIDVIGTMNTADRSIALLDTALRRRFRFDELMPQPGLLVGTGDGQIPDGAGGIIDLRRLLQTINLRLAHLLHRDQTIGHSYFYNVRSFPELQRVLAREILPLLQEFFYDDWSQIRLVLADQVVGDPEFQIVSYGHAVIRRRRFSLVAIRVALAIGSYLKWLARMRSRRTQSARSTSHWNEAVHPARAWLIGSGGSRRNYRAGS